MQGMCQYSDGNRFEGEWKNNLPHGAGSCKFQVRAFWVFVIRMACHNRSSLIVLSAKSRRLKRARTCVDLYICTTYVIRTVSQNVCHTHFVALVLCKTSSDTVWMHSLIHEDFMIDPDYIHHHTHQMSLSCHHTHQMSQSRCTRCYD